jgi:hypothetical protein
MPVLVNPLESVTKGARAPLAAFNTAADAAPARPAIHGKNCS